MFVLANKLSEELAVIELLSDDIQWEFSDYSFESSYQNNDFDTNNTQLHIINDGNLHSNFFQ